MPIITHALLYAGYALVSLTIGLALNQVGGESGTAAFLGGIGLFSACAVTHAGIAASFAAGRIGAAERRIKSDVDRLREAHREVIGDIDAVSARLEALEQKQIAMAGPRQIESPAPAAPELKLIDQIVDRLGQAMDARLGQMQSNAGAQAGAAAPNTGGTIDVVRTALMQNRVELHLQPIVALPQRRTAFYEGFTRLKDEAGRIILPQDFIPMAEKAGMMGMIDNVLLFRCVQIVRKLMKQDRRVGIFCNISPHSLSDEHFFAQFLDFMKENLDLAGALIFEIPQEAFESRSSIEARAMGKLIDLGFRFSIDHITSIEIDLLDLERSGVRYVKASAELLGEQLVRDNRRPKSAITREIAAADVAAVFSRYGVDLIAERIEAEETVLEVLDLDVPYAQGHLFGAPRAIKESLMEETAPPRDFFFKQGRVA
jgi:cyclic-di-GMP phosphodiesterase TipF (flagellum assembly factor)